MTPYTKKIVELHKIHKAIEEKDCCNGGGNSDSSSKEITIDDVVKFIHDNTINDIIAFPYTKYNEIPDIPTQITDTPISTGYYKGTLEAFNIAPFENIPDIVLYTDNYVIIYYNATNNKD